MACGGCGHRRRARAKQAKPTGAAPAMSRRNAAGPVRKPAQVVPRASRAKSAQAFPYTVMRGDSMASIAKKFGMDLRDLVRFDGGTGVANLSRLRSRNARAIRPGEIILIPMDRRLI